jgi:carbonic anhydrase/acetyltransferase-like protein (isoleucine patch superfamily)
VYKKNVQIILSSRLAVITCLLDEAGGNPVEKKNIYRFMLEHPQYGARVFIDQHASVSGSVVLGDDVSVWPMAVIRGDVNRIRIGARSNIQDGAVLHVTHEGPWAPEGLPLNIGEDVTVGHAAVLHACTVGDRCLVGMGAIVLDGVVLESESMVAAGAVVTPGTIVPSGTLWRGNPAREARALRETEISNQAYGARHYVKLKDLYLERI